MSNKSYFLLGNILMKFSFYVFCTSFLFCIFSLHAAEKQKTVVLTFDDSCKSHASFVAPYLKKLGFNATFFITEGFSFHKRKDLYMTWAEIKQLHKDGFEIGNHTRHHRSMKKLSYKDIDATIDYIEKQCKKHGIPKPVSFCYPGYQTSEDTVKVLKKRGYKFARKGGMQASKVNKDNPLLLPQAFDGRPASTLELFINAVKNADDKNIPILTFHGIPDHEHPWVSTNITRFKKYMQYLKDNNYKVIALRDYPKKK